jgi:tellurite resistance protein TerC
MESPVTIYHWVAFNLAIATLLFLDLGILHRKSKVIPVRAALWQSAAWISLALSFGGLVWWWLGRQSALEYITGYLIELSLSVDNLFVFLLIFSYFAVPRAYQYRVLLWGVLGAMVMRLSFILAGVALLERFEWLIYIFGAFLIYTAWKVVSQGEHEVHPERNPILRIVRRVLPITENYVEDRLFTRQSGRLLATPLFVVLLVVETTDVVFAIDSIPAILAITKDPFIVYSSNALAILGLRALFFAISGLLDYLEYLDYGLGGVLAFIGVKMLITAVHIHIPVGISLAVVASILTLSVLASLVLPARGKAAALGENDAEEG